jgi:hypothetical protein
MGLFLVAMGLATSFLAVAYWEQRSFGPLDPSRSLRLVIPGGVLLATGFQIIFSVFFLSILRLRRK